MAMAPDDRKVDERGTPVTDEDQLRAGREAAPDPARTRPVPPPQAPSQEEPFVNDADRASPDPMDDALLGAPDRKPPP